MNHRPTTYKDAALTGLSYAPMINRATDEYKRKLIEQQLNVVLWSLKGRGLFCWAIIPKYACSVFQQSELNSTSRETPTHNSLQVTTNKLSSGFLGRLLKMN